MIIVIRSENFINMMIHYSQRFYITTPFVYIFSYVAGIPPTKLNLAENQRLT